MLPRNADGTFRLQPPKALRDYHYQPAKPPPPQCLAIVPYKRAPFRCPRFVSHCLSELGVTLPPKFKVLWREDNDFVDQLLEQATSLYERLRFHFHPRTLNDNPEPAKSLNALWARLKKLFRNRLHPSLMIYMVDAGPGKRLSAGHVRCAVCRKPFKPKRKRRIDPVCSNTCWRRRSRELHRKPKSRVRCANPRCPVRFTPVSKNHKFHSTPCADSHRFHLEHAVDPQYFRDQNNRSYRRNHAAIRKRRRGLYSRLPEATKAIYRKREALRGFKKRQDAKISRLAILAGQVQSPPQ